MNTSKDNKWRNGKALERYTLIAPLLEGSLDPAKRLQMREDIASRNGISLRSLYRYEAAFKKEGFSGLKPAERPKQHSAKLPDNFKEILEQAVQLKREVPTRSVNQIIYILELEGWAPAGTLKRSTMQRHLYNAGFGQKQMQMYRDARNSSSKRFCKPHRMMLIQGGSNSPLEKTVQWYRRICPQPLMTIPVTYSIQGFMITRRNPSWKILSIKPYSRQENLMPATLITVHSTLPDS